MHGTRVLKPDHLIVHHFRAGYEFSARNRMRKIPLVETFDYTITVDQHFTVFRYGADEPGVSVVVVIVVGERPEGAD